MSSKIEKQIRKYFKDKCNIDLTNEDYLEVHQSLYHLGKALYLSSVKEKIKTNKQSSVIIN